MLKVSANVRMYETKVVDCTRKEDYQTERKRRGRVEAERESESESDNGMNATTRECV